MKVRVIIVSHLAVFTTEPATITTEPVTTEDATSEFCSYVL